MGKIVYEKITPVTCWINLMGEYESEIKTYVVEYQFLWMTFRTIKQVVPYIKNQLYDGEYATNRMLKSIAEYEEQLAQYWVDSK